MRQDSNRGQEIAPISSTKIGAEPTGRGEVCFRLASFRRASESRRTVVAPRVCTPSIPASATTIRDLPARAPPLSIRGARGVRVAVARSQFLGQASLGASGGDDEQHDCGECGDLVAREPEQAAQGGEYAMQEVGTHHGAGPDGTPGGTRRSSLDLARNVRAPDGEQESGNDHCPPPDTAQLLPSHRSLQRVDRPATRPGGVPGGAAAAASPSLRIPVPLTREAARPVGWSTPTPPRAPRRRFRCCPRDPDPC